MLRAVLVALMVALPGVAGAFDAAAAIDQYNRTRPECRQAETTDGATLTKEQSDAACDRLDTIGKTLRANNYCFDPSEQEWAVCKS